MLETAQSVKIVPYDIDTKRAEKIKQTIEKYQIFIPWWVRTIDLCCDSKVSYCQVELLRNYNSISIQISPDWTYNEHDIVHELAHAFNANQLIFFDQSVLPLINEEIRGVIEKLYEKQSEQDTESIAYMMEKVIDLVNF